MVPSATSPAPGPPVRIGVKCPQNRPSADLYRPEPCNFIVSAVPASLSRGHQAHGNPARHVAGLSPGWPCPCWRSPTIPPRPTTTPSSNFLAVLPMHRHLGLGNRGALAAKPVMRQGVLSSALPTSTRSIWKCPPEDPDEFINCVNFSRRLGRHQSGRHQAPECFIIEQRLARIDGIPVFHDDQHGTAIISAAGLINALHLTAATSDYQLVCNGAGAAASPASTVQGLRLQRREPHPVRHQGRDLSGAATDGMNQWKSAYAVKTSERTVARRWKARTFRRPLGQGAVTKAMV